MAAFVKRYKVDPSIRMLAQQITRGLKSHDELAEVTALQHFVRDRIRYVKDVDGVETLQAPPYTLKMQSGDCDDKAILLATLLGSVGYPAQFIALGFNGRDFTHVLTAVKLGTRFIPLETIVNGAEPGWFPKGANPVLPWNI